MGPDSSRGPDDRHGAQGERGLSAVMGEGPAPENGVGFRGGEGRVGVRKQAEALEGLHI